MTFTGSSAFVNCSSLRSYETYHEAGAITLYQSNITFTGMLILQNNHAQDGGAMYIFRSKLYIYAGNTTISDNEALDTGGGVFLYKSEFYCDTQYPLQNTQLNISSNRAVNRGGGIYAISSSIKLGEARIELFPSTVGVYLLANRANKGGGIGFEANAKLTLYLETSSRFILHHNLADYGGAMYVADDTNSGTCFNASYEDYTGCFIEALWQDEGLAPVTPTYSFHENFAKISGHNLYGGLLDRCTTSWVHTQVGIITANVFFYLQNVSNVSIDTISSDPMRLCFCKSGKPDCSYSPYPIYVRKGRNFTVSLVAVDQVLHTKDYIPIHSNLSSTESKLGIGQLTQITNLKGTCSSLTFTVYSPHMTEELTLYASGPCKDARPSQGRLAINFLPCVCPIGFEEIETNMSCECECDPRLRPYITECNAETKTVVREGDFWISYSNSTLGDYLIYPHCPLDYCTQSKLLVNLNTLDGPDIQCINNRRGELCGACKPDFSLSLGTSSCVACPKDWFVMFTVIFMLSILAGVGLVALLLALNLTVGVGTLNGLIFYANIVDANSGTFFSASNSVAVLIAWLNLEIGFDVCFIKGLDSYWKTWLQLAFPTYVIILVVAIIFVSERSTKFARLIGRRNPVATLATLILLSYTKILRTIIAALSFAVPEGAQKIVWLPDASVGYFSGRHVSLVIVALFILIAGTIYTAILFSWQWLLRHQNKVIVKCVRHQRLHLFLEPYFAPFAFKHRYWMGLLLLVRVVLYLFTVSVSTVVHEPARWNLLIIIVAIVCLLLPKILVGIKVYKSIFIDILETISYLNILMFCIAKPFTKIEGSEQTVIAYISGMIFLVLIVFVILYHIFTEICSRTEIWRKLTRKKMVSQLTDSNISHVNDETSFGPPTSSVVERPPHGEVPLSAMVETNGAKREKDMKSEPVKSLLVQGHHSLASAVPYQLMKKNRDTL